MYKNCRKIIFLICFAVATPAVAQDSMLDGLRAKRYERCLDLVERDPNQGLISAQNWYIEGGGVAAEHCEALALYSLNNFASAAAKFDNIVSKLTLGDGTGEFAYKNRRLLKIQLSYLSGIAWQEADDYDKAYDALSAAITGLDAGSSYAYDIYLERGHVQMTRKEYENAANDFTEALEINADKIDAFLYRAEAYRKSGQHLRSRLDINAGLEIDANNPDLLFESGVNYRMRRNDEKAIQEWEKLIKKYPNSRWQKLAEDNIKLIIE